jgi:DnaJ-domain-containing protein 1
MDAHSLVIIALCALVGYGIVSLTIARFRRRPQEKTQQNGSRRGDANEPPQPTAKPSAPRRWHEVLRVNATASADEIKRAYRSLIIQYHPDRVAGLGPELRDIAEAKAKEINAAYVEGMRVRN